MGPVSRSDLGKNYFVSFFEGVDVSWHSPLGKTSQALAET